jgi:hypothetical protein
LTARADGVLARAVAAAASGAAPDAETELYRRFAPRIRLLGLERLADRGAADDLAQPVMLVVIPVFRRARFAIRIRLARSSWARAG